MRESLLTMFEVPSDSWATTRVRGVNRRMAFVNFILIRLMLDLS